jgi:hypothetical protein
MLFFCSIPDTTQNFLNAMFPTQYDESTVIEVEPESEVQPHLPSPTSQSEEAEIVIGRDDEQAASDARRIQDKWREILDSEQDWPGHQYSYDIIVSTHTSLRKVSDERRLHVTEMRMLR